MTDVNSLKNSFKDEKLLTKALTHTSWVNENKDERGSNERLEFLGDAVLELAVSKELYKQFPDKEEGFLTALRANLVNTTNLANVAKKLKLGDEIYLSKGEEEGVGRKNPSLLANTVEAIIGAIYLDQGMEACEKFVSENLLKDVPDKVKGPLKDAKSRLQEHVQAEGLPTPSYKIVEESGPDHAKNFIVEVRIGKKRLTKGEGSSKNRASQKAAEKALAKLITT